MNGRFSDRDEAQRYLRPGNVLVRCPRCAGRAVATASRVTCVACGYVTTGEQPEVRIRFRADGRCSRCGRSLEQWRYRLRRSVPRTLPLTCPGCGAITALPVSTVWQPGQPVTGLDQVGQEPR